MHGTVKWVDGVMTLAESGSGHSVVMDGPPELEAKIMGASHGDAASGNRWLRTFRRHHDAQKSRQSISNCRVELQAERSDGVPAVFTAINLHFVVEGEGLKDNQVARAVQLSAEKYCSASIMLATGGVEVTHSHETHSR